MFTIDGNTLDFSSLYSIEKRKTVTAIIEVSKSIGSENSIIKLAKVLEALDAKIEHHFELLHNGQAKYDKCFRYDRGFGYFNFSIDTVVSGVSDQVSYEKKLRGVLYNLVPCRIHL